MTKRPERPKATRLHAPVQVEQIKQTRHQSVEGKTAETESRTKTEPTKSAKADKVMVFEKGMKAGLHQNDNKNISTTVTGKENKEKHSKTVDQKTYRNANGLPKGFVNKADMENKMKNKNRVTEFQSNTHIKNGSEQSKSTDVVRQKGVVRGHVSRKDMEAKLLSRKTKATKITPVHPKTEVGREEGKSPEKTSPVVERRKINSHQVDPKGTKPFSILENKEKVSPSTNTEPYSKSPTRARSNSIGKGKGEKGPALNKAIHTKPPLPKLTNQTDQSKQSKVDTVKVKDHEDEVSRQQSASTALSSNTTSTRISKHAMTTRNTSTAIPKPAIRQLEAKNSAGQATLPSVKILIMNANGRDDKGGSPAERRKNAIQNVVIKHMPHITLFQEFVWIGITGKTWSKYPFPEHYVYKGHSEASIMYDDNYVTVQDLPQTDLDTILKGLQANSNNRLKRTFPMDFMPMSRMCICRITAPTKPGLDFICISWHGRSNEKGGGRMKELKKIEYFEYWMEFLRNIREKYKLPILAAGDYNVDMYSIEKCVESPFKLCLYEASMRRTVRGIVDYCIVTEDLDVSDITWVNLERDTTVFHPNGILDHDPVVCNLQVSALAATGAAMGFGKKKAWPSPIAKVK